MTILEIAGNVLLFALVFGMSATVEFSSVEHQLQNKKAILVGCFCQFVLLPLLGYGVVEILDLDAPLGVTLLVVVCSPGGSYSNWWCSLFNADLALSVTMTAISTILSVFTLPGNLIMYANLAYEADVTSQLDWTSIFTALVVVMSAIILGIYVSARVHSLRFKLIANKLGNLAGLLLIIFSATVTNMGDAESRIWSRDWSFYAACAIPCFLGLVLASILSSFFKLEPPERMTVGIECCYQNVGVATSVALTMFEGADMNNAMGIPFFFGVCEAVMVGIYAVGCWKCGWTKAPSDAPLWKVISTSYEIVAVHGEEVEALEHEHDESGTQRNNETAYIEIGEVDKTSVKV